MNVFRIYINPPGLHAKTRAGTAASALRNVLYWHGCLWGRGKGDCVAECSWADDSEAHETLWTPKATVYKLAQDREGVIERGYWEPNEYAENAPKEPEAGDIYELQSSRRRSGLVVQLIADPEYRLIADPEYLGNPTETIERLSVKVLPEYSYWPWNEYDD